MVWKNKCQDNALIERHPDNFLKSYSRRHFSKARSIVNSFCYLQFATYKIFANTILRKSNLYPALVNHLVKEIRA